MSPCEDIFQLHGTMYFIVILLKRCERKMSLFCRDLRVLQLITLLFEQKTVLSELNTIVTVKCSFIKKLFKIYKCELCLKLSCRLTFRQCVCAMTSCALSSETSGFSFSSILSSSEEERERLDLQNHKQWWYLIKRETFFPSSLLKMSTETKSSRKQWAKKNQH